MTLTDELRAELAKCGVEYETADISTYKFTRWCNNGIDAGWGEFENWGQPHLLVIGFTPEQAIAATVDGTCRLVDNESGPDMHCTACGREVDDEYRYFMERWGYSRCPHCGRRIGEDE